MFNYRSLFTPLRVLRLVLLCIGAFYGIRRAAAQEQAMWNFYSTDNYFYAHIKIKNTGTMPLYFQNSYDNGASWSTSAYNWGDYSGPPATPYWKWMYVTGSGSTLIQPGATYQLPVVLRNFYPNTPFTGTYNCIAPVMVRAMWTTIANNNYVYHYGSPKGGNLSMSIIMNFPVNPAVQNPVNPQWGPTLNISEKQAIGKIAVKANYTGIVTVNFTGGIASFDLPVNKGVFAEWQTTSPQSYPLGTRVTIRDKPTGQYLADEKIVYDSEGGFDIQFAFDPLKVDPVEGIHDELEGMNPNPVTDSPTEETGDRSTLDGRKPGPILTDPADAPEDSDDKNMYEAVRAGVRDGLNGDVNVGGANGGELPSDTRGAKVGTAASSVFSQAAAPGMSVKPVMASSSGLVINFLGYSMSIPTPGWLLSARPWIEFLIHVLGLLGTMRLLRVAFS